MWCRTPTPLPQGSIGRGGGTPPFQGAQPTPSRFRQVPASMAFVTDSNRPQPLWQPRSTAYLTASGAASEVPSTPRIPPSEPPLLTPPRPIQTGWAPHAHTRRGPDTAGIMSPQSFVVWPRCGTDRRAHTGGGGTPRGTCTTQHGTSKPSIRRVTVLGPVHTHGRTAAQGPVFAASTPAECVCRVYPCLPPVPPPPWPLVATLYVWL